MARSVLLVTAVCLAVGARTSVAQEQAAGSPLAASEAFERGRNAYEAEAYAEARLAFQAVFDVQPAYVGPQQESAAHWLGRTLMALDKDAEAVAVWGAGVQALSEAGLFDAEMGDAFVRAVYDGAYEGAYDLAAAVYLHLLRRADGAPPAEWAVLRPHLRVLAWVVPTALAEAAGLGLWAERTDAAGPDHLVPGAGARLAAWWQGQDPLPSTPQNERLREHLERVAYAAHHYNAGDALDDRARVYVRLGPPYKKTRVRFNSQEFTNKVVFRQLTLSGFDFPENEFWTYNHIDEAAHYLFVADGGYYRLGTPNDLAPRTLRQGVNASERGIRKAEALIRTFEEIYKELSLLHDDFALRYQDVADFAELLDQQEILSQAELERQAMEQGVALKDVARSTSGPQAPPVRTDLLPSSPHAFSQKLVARGTYEDGLAAQRRAERVPPAYSAVLRDTDALPVAVRTARFLGEDGTTRTDVYWGVLPGGFEPAQEMAAPAVLVSLVTAQRDASYQNRALHVNRHLVRLGSAAVEQALTPQQATVEGDTGLYHLALQWDVNPVELDPQGRPAHQRPLAMRGTARVDSLRALASDPAVLEMSDLKPLLMGDPTVDPAEATPYPYAGVTLQTPLGLYFEVYGLTYGPGDQTRFSVDYQVTQTREGRLLRPARREVTSAEAQRAGTARTARETLLLDPAEWDGADAVEIAVTVTDVFTGQQATRFISFAVSD